MDVCVTGGTGYIASSIIRKLLEKGFRVRTTVRNPDDKAKTGFLWELPGAMERLEVVRGDLMEDGSFDMAVEGVHTVFHAACPVFINPEGDPQVTMLDPALKGSMNVLKACAKAASVKRVVMTSSSSAIRYDYNRQATDPPLNESVWSNPEYCREYKLWYPLAKTLAEREAFAFAASVGLDLVAVHPSFVVGPFITPVPQSSIKILLSLLKGSEYPNSRLGFVHIDDVVTAHLLAMEVPEANGRYICSSDVLHFSDIVDILRLKCPKLTVASRCSDRKGDNFHHKMDSTKLKNLGLAQLKSVDQMFDDVLKCFHEKGLIGDYQ
ncbi:hypothetical protein KC19_12G095500 [Ceratodon purpureus]|uniref:NAD-dependent epimerase/dehydratase domain-containing protein n=1 Tax=Ceratodon purpureus TaxID=3225 RepID=A0A8T0G811_CERPU|nr:hypothetical protein KC19_12G095500 [Ceratodon purpureus]KAG0554495.1 hypothetical protein KC19_12G095500 [Ceratodon purpureus]